MTFNFSMRRKTAIVMTVVSGLPAAYLIVVGYFTTVVLLVLIALPYVLRSMLPMCSRRKPAVRPVDDPAAARPLWFVGSAFVFTRRFGLLYIAGLIIDTVLRRTILQT